jgi:hypothetical protein
LAYVWAEDLDDKLREKQTDVDRYTSADYWLEHPELHAVIQTGLGLLRLFTMQMDRAVWASESETVQSGKGAEEQGSKVATQPAMPLEARRDGSNVNGREWPEDGGKARYQAFLEKTHDRHGKGRPYTEDTRQIARYWEDEARDFSNAGFWEDKLILRSALKNGLTLLRLFTDQAAQAIEARQKENEAEDPKLGREPARG